MSFLTIAETDELLEYVWGAGEPDIAYPMFAFAAHTGARRSEMIRSRLDDIDFDKDIRHHPRTKEGAGQADDALGSLLLRRVLKDWVTEHPGGSFTFRDGHRVAASSKESRVLLGRDFAENCLGLGFFQAGLADGSSAYDPFSRGGFGDGRKRAS